MSDPLVPEFARALLSLHAALKDARARQDAALVRRLEQQIAQPPYNRRDVRILSERLRRGLRTPAKPTHLLVDGTHPVAVPLSK